jgi:hypothetical protein
MVYTLHAYRTVDQLVTTREHYSTNRGEESALLGFFLLIFEVLTRIGNAIKTNKQDKSECHKLLAAGANRRLVNVNTY